MDRDDARLVANALTSRLAGDREELDRLAATSLVALMRCAKRIEELADGDPAALKASLELKAICRHGAGVAETEADHDLQKIVDIMLRSSIAGLNRADRRAAAAKLPRAQRRATLPPAPLQ